MPRSRAEWRPRRRGRDERGTEQRGGRRGALFLAFRSVEQSSVENRQFSEPRRRVIASSLALQERELAEIGSLTAALASALRQRGDADRLALLAAQTGMATLGHAVRSWPDDGPGDLDDHLVQAFRDVRALSASDSKSPLTACLFRWGLGPMAPAGRGQRPRLAFVRAP